MECPECGGEFVEGVETCPDCRIALVVAVVPEPPPLPEPEPLAPDGASVVLIRTGRLYEADLVASVLEDEGVPFYRQEQSSSGLSFAMPVAPSAGPGVWWVIRVPEAVAEKARALVENLPVRTDPSPGVWDFGPSSPAKSLFKTWAFLTLVLLILWILGGLWSFLRELLSP